MDQLYPIYTRKTECQDCYRCVRQCPVKAIKVEGGHANVIPELCIACGHCVEVCPAGAKQVRNDLERLRQLLQNKQQVMVSLAPSWVSEFPNVTGNQMVSLLSELGFAAASETALGAEEVSAGVADLLQDKADGLYISSACPAAVNFVQKYLPERTENLTKMVSPVLAHCKLLKREYGDQIGIVMVSPCISKKTEADKHPELLDLALTFADLRQLMEERELKFTDFPRKGNQVFVPETSTEGQIYPVEGGMIDTIRHRMETDNVLHVTLSGISEMDNALAGVYSNNFGRPIFVEALACRGGCINGPCTTRERAGLLDRLSVLENVHLPEKAPKATLTEKLFEQFAPETVVKRDQNINEKDIAAALQAVGKYSPNDELNCGGCGYESCRNFAQALHLGYAEPAMCVSYLRRQAQKKANALIRCMPSSVVIVDQDLKIVECNERFAKMFGTEAELAYDARPGLGGALLDRIIPFAELFRNTLHTGQDLHRDSYRYRDRLLNITVFIIEPQQVAGAIIVDVTKTEMHREQIADRAREVIEKNLSTVQEIACRLGEHMADTEILLRSIAEGYGADYSTYEREDKKPQ